MLPPVKVGGGAANTANSCQAVQRLSFINTTTSRCTCVGCKRTIAISITPLLCCCCDSAYHRSCSGLTKDAATTALHGGSWICNRCAVAPPSRSNTVAQSRTEVSEPPCRTSKPTLRILQWNADGLYTKVQELRDRLAAESIDVCLIQETKFPEKDASPPFPGYNSIRFGHPSTHRGGGLLTLVKEGIVFQPAAEDYSPPLERLTIQIQLSRRRWTTVHNL